MFAENLAAFFDVDEFAVPVIMGAVTTTGIVNMEDDVVLAANGQAAVVGRDRVVIVRTGDVVASGLEEDDPIIVDGISRVARVIDAMDDGALTRIELSGV